MIRAVTSDASVGRCTTTRRATITRTGTGITGTTPGDERYRRRLAAVTLEAVEGVFAVTVLDNMTTLLQLGVLPRDGLAVAIDCYLMPRYDRINDGHLTISRYKNGTKYFERYVTIHCVNDGLRLAPGCLPVPAGAPVPGDGSVAD